MNSTAMTGEIKWLVILLSLVAFVVTECECGPYKGYKLMKVQSRNKEQFNFLHQQRKDNFQLDYWQGPFFNKTSVLLVPPSLVTKVKVSWTMRGMTWEEGNIGVDEAVAANMRRREIPMSPNGQVIDHSNYHRYDQIVTYLNSLATKYPNYVTVLSMNELSYENRSIAYVMLNGESGHAGKPSVMVEAGIHAREWISPAAALYFMDKVLQKYADGDKDAKFMLDTYTWYIVPVVNPDGYEFTHTSFLNRFWRKNRRQVDEYCIGTDLNRNFDIEFGTVATSDSCFDELFPGDKAFSESEARNLRDLFTSINDSVVSYLGVHSYGQFVLIPWSYSYDKNPATTELGRVGKLMSAAIKTNSGKEYQDGTSYAVMDKAASGTSLDWALRQKKDLYAFTYELRPSYDKFAGFLLPATEIVPTSEEFYASLLVLAREMPPGKNKSSIHSTTTFVPDPAVG